MNKNYKYNWCFRSYMLVFMIFRPVSAYALFFRDTQAVIKGKHPNASFGEVSKIVASMWDALELEHKNVNIIISMVIFLYTNDNYIKYYSVIIMNAINIIMDLTIFNAIITESNINLCIVLQKENRSS